MTTLTINYKPHVRQVPFHDSNAKFRAIISGVGMGKSAAGCNEFIKWMIKYPKALHVILAPTSKVMRFGTLRQFFKFCPENLIHKYNKTEKTIQLINGAEAVCLTADNERHIDRLRGIEIGDFWADEGRLFKGYVWQMLLTRLRDSNGPLKGLLTTTPRGYNWIHSYFIKKEDPITKKKFNKPENYEWWGGSTEDNPYLPQEYIDNLKDQLVGSFLDQEFYGKFTSFEGLVYSTFNREIHVKKLDLLHKYEQVQGWIDWGFTNPMVCLWVGIDTDGRAYVLDEYYKSKITVDEFINYCDVRSKQFYNFSHFVADPSEPEHIAQFNNKGLTCYEANNAIIAGINRVNTFIKVQGDGKPRLFVNEDCIHTIDEFDRYSHAEKKEGKPDTEKPPKQPFDHAMDALRYGIMNLPNIHEEEETFVGFAR